MFTKEGVHFLDGRQTKLHLARVKQAFEPNDRRDEDLLKERIPVAFTILFSASSFTFMVYLVICLQKGSSVFSLKLS